MAFNRNYLLSTDIEDNYGDILTFTNDLKVPFTIYQIIIVASPFALMAGDVRKID